MSTDYDKEQDAKIQKNILDIKKLNDKVFGAPSGPDPEPTECGPDPDPNDEHIREGGWGGDMAGAATWESVQMKDDPNLWKVVDKEGKNIAHKFASEAEADVYIKYHQCIQEQGNPVEPPPVVEPPVEPGTEPKPPEPVLGDYPYAAKGNPMKGVQKGPLTRHYASGKPDDKTIEMNVKSIPFDNLQFVVYVTMNKMEHDDTVSTKLGGTHMGTGWFDNSVGVYTGKTGLGIEPDHPDTTLFIVKGPAIGDIRGKKVGICSTYFKKINKTELWTNVGDGWKKQCEGKDVGGFNPKASSSETQLRIDGFDEVPTIHSAIVTEIEAQD